jgi:hypothetical protein
LYPISVAFGQHEPGTERLKLLSMGVHCTQLNRTLRPMAILMVIMTNQMATFSQPCEMRSRVNANEVLLRAAADTEKKPEMSRATNIGGQLLGRIS